MAFDLLVWAYGESPARLFTLLLQGTWGSSYGAGQVLFKATPLLFTGVAVDLALRAGLFNIGAEGQLSIASLAAAAAGGWLPADTPGPIAVPLVLAAAALAGGLWALVPAVLKMRFGAHEVISTIMMNRIAEATIGLVLGMGLALKGTVRTRDLIAGAHVLRLGNVIAAFRGSAASLALGLAVLLALLVGWSYQRTRFGREVTLIGKNAIACLAERIPVGRRLAQVMILSGAIAGLLLPAPFSATKAISSRV
jgi:simple sugar transport system permease protein